MTNESILSAEDPSVDLVIAEAMLDELEDYIVKDDLYRTVIARTSAGDRQMNMSGGDFYSRLMRLQGARHLLTEDERTRLDSAQQKADEIIYSLRTRFNQRLNLELKSRLDSLRYFLRECAEDSGKCRVEYPFEMRNRQRIQTILQLLGADAEPTLVEILEQVDKSILRATKESSFVWDEQLQSTYPPETYWYLYRRP